MIDREPRPAGEWAAVALVAGIVCGVPAAVIWAGDVSSDPAQAGVQMMGNTFLLMILVPTSAVLIVGGAVGIGRALVAPSARPTRPPPITLVAVLVGIVGVVGVAVASLMLLGSFGDPVTLAVSAVLGAGGLATANGIWAVQRWGRIGGIVLCVAVVVLALAGQTAIWLPVLAVPSLWILVRGWPAEP